MGKTMTSPERIVGLAQYVVTDSPSSSADLACSVIDDYQGRGIGALLLEHVLRFARHGVPELLFFALAA